MEIWSNSFWKMGALALGVCGGISLLMRPGRGGRRRLEPFLGRHFAHRGLHDGNRTVAENSLASFRRAIEEGYGIELDVRPLGCGGLVVFHDRDLSRVCGLGRPLERLDMHRLGECRLPGGERIPTLEDVLALVRGRVPLLVEIKAEGPYARPGRMAWLCRQVAQRLDKYSGLVAVQSFHPGVLAWFAKHRPLVPRGQLADDFRRSKPGEHRGWGYFLLENLLCNFLSRPDYVAYNHRYLGKWSLRLGRWLWKTPMAGWTIEDKKVWNALGKRLDICIFERFEPKK